MLEKPDLLDERLIARLDAAYGLRVAQVAFLPLGADANTAVYRVEAADTTAEGVARAFYLKLRRGSFDELTVALPAFLSSRGITAVIAPLPTLDRQLAARLDPFMLALYPFVAGVDGYEAELSETQWVALGAALQRLHSIRLPPAIRRALPREDFSPRYRQRVQALLGRARGSRFEDPLAAELAGLLSARAAQVRQLLAAADSLAGQLPSQPRPLAVCHGDVHNGNVLLSGADRLHLVDWDTALLAPKERDLMFLGSGLLGRQGKEAQEAAWFYHGYGAAQIDAAVVAYYRCERVVQDIDAFCQQILATTSDGPDRRQALRYLASQFEPGDVVEIALESAEASAPD